MRPRTTWWRRAAAGAQALASWPPARLVLAIILLVALGLLAGCSTQPQTQTVKVAIPVECREATPVRPAMPTESLQAGADLDTQVAALLAEIELLEGYEGLLLAALAVCQRPVAPAP